VVFYAYGEAELKEYLLDKGAVINHLNITGLTALDIARDLGRTEMIDFLIKSGANDKDRMLEHLVTYRQDLYIWDNDT
jgi:ankyrin repeat protein